MPTEIEDTPNCPACLHSLEIAGSDARPYWACLDCGHISLTA